MSEKKAVILSVQPGWMLSGIVREEDANTITLDSATYIETVGDGLSVWAASRLARAAKCCWPMEDGTVVNRHTINICSPASVEVVEAIAHKAVDYERATKGLRGKPLDD